MRLRLSPLPAFVLGILVFAAAQRAYLALHALAPLQTPLFERYGFKTVLVVVSVALMLVEALSRRGRSLGEFGWRLPRAGALDWLLATALGALIGACGSLLVIFSPAKGMQAVLGEMRLVDLVLAVWVWSSLTEEVFARGLVQSWMDGWKGRGLHFGALFVSSPVMTSALLFGSMHLTLLLAGCDWLTVAIIVAMTFATGLVAGWYRERTDSLALAVAAHVAANLGGMVGGVIGMLLQAFLGR